MKGMTMTSVSERHAPRDGPVTLINVFEVPAEEVDAFRDTRLHRAVSPQARFQLVNVAHWDSQAQLDAAQKVAEFGGQ
jgi:heme oxygenase (mycobilin-producing)